MTAGSKLRIFLLRLLTVVVPVVVLWGIPEIAVRIAQPVLQQYRAISFGNDTNSPALFIQDPVLFWRLRPAACVRFMGVQVQINRDGCRGRELSEGRRNILCLGDSTTFGWGVPESDTYSSILEGLLNEPGGGNPAWQVINAGVPGYSSYQMVQVIPSLLKRWKPDIVVICVGNNDSWPAKQSDIAIAKSHRWTIGVQRVMSHSMFALWLKERLNPQTPQPFIAETLAGATPRVSAADFSGNVRKLILAARLAQAEVLIVEPPVNLYKPPFVTRKLPDLDAWADWCRDVHRMAAAGRTDEAIRAAEAKLEIDPANVYALWIKGFAVTAAGRILEGRTLLEQSLEVHPFPEGCRLSYREFLARVAGEENCGYVPVNKLLLAAETEKGPMGRLYLDSCHPTPEGHRLIAFSLRDLIRPGGRVPANASSKATAATR